VRACSSPAGRHGARSGSRPPNDGCRAAGVDAIDRLVRQRIGGGVLGPWHVDGRPAIEGSQCSAGGLPERDELRVLDAPAAGELFDDELRVEEHRDLARTELAGEGERADDPCVLGDVICLDPEVVGDRGVGGSSGIGRVRSRGVDQDRTRGRRSGIAAGGTVGPDDEAQRIGRGLGLRDRPEGRVRPAVARAQPDAPLVGPPDEPPDEPRGRIGGGLADDAASDATSDEPPRSLRQTIWIGS
jgi:hypothetical protein